MQKKDKIWIACGGTGGHFLPGIVCGKNLEQHDYECHYWGEGKPIEDHLCKDHHVALTRPQTGGGRLKRGSALLILMLKKIFKEKPQLCILCGGFTSLIMTLFAIISRTPIVMLEQNAIPGRINRLCSFVAKMAFVTFPDSESYLHTECHHIGNPVRMIDKKCEKIYDLLIIGGSQGAKTLNEQLPKLILGELNIVHICGPNNVDKSKLAWSESKHNVEIHEQHNNIPKLASMSRWVISRAGATSLSELASLGCSTIAVPYPFAKDNHQLANARYLEKQNAVIILEEKNFKNWGNKLNKTLNDLDKAKEIGENIYFSKIADVNGEETVKRILKILS